MPAFGAPAAVELLPEFAQGLLKIEKHSHFWVMAWLMARPERDVLQVIPRGVDADAPDPMHGVFAVRSPARPNPIGLTAARLVKREGLTLQFERLDFLDGTPVLDLKPYFPSRDLIFSARNKPVGRPRTREALRESLTIQTLQHQTARHADVAIAIRVLEHYRSEVLGWREPVKWSIEAPLNRPALCDALMGATRATLASGMTFGASGRVRFHGRVEYGILPRRWTFAQALKAGDSDLFAVTKRK